MADDATDRCLAKREPGEPIFSLLARDSTGPDTIEGWCRLREAEIANGTRRDDEGQRADIAEARERAEEFRAWRLANRT